MSDELKASFLRASIEDDEQDSSDGDAEEKSVDTRDISELDEDEFVERYTDLVANIAHKIQSNHPADIPFEDLRAYGFEGLLEARQRYDSDKGVSFSSFAYYRIRGAILDSLRSGQWSKRNMDFNIDDRVALNDHLSDDHEAHGHLPRAQTFRDSIDRIDQMVGDSITVLLMRHFDVQDIQATEEDPQHQDLQKRRQLARIREALDELSENEHEVVTRYHLQEESMGSIADDLDYSKSWVSRINSRAIQKIRDHINVDT